MSQSQPNPPVLMIEDTASLQMVYRSVLTAAGFSVQVAETAAEGLRLFRQTQPPIVLLDLMLPDRDGIGLLSDLLALAPETLVVVMTAHGSVDRAVEAMRAGAFDFLLKPFEENRFLAAMRAAADAAMRRPPGLSDPSGRPVAAMRAQRRRAEEARAGLDATSFIGASEAMARVHRTITSVARSMASVFITGESGTGKELAALAVHGQSARAQGPFIALNCGAIPPDLLESEVFGHMKGSFTGAISDKPGAAVAADGGTLFLDEVCEMAPALQTKLLRFLQTSTVQPVGATRPRRVDVRIICATNRDPIDAIRDGQFREDLFYRLYVVPIHMPPLRDRAEDAVEIARAALAQFAAEEGKRFDGFAPETERLLTAHDWPGNVRQLLNVVRNVVVLNEGGQVTPGMLPLSLAPDLSLADPRAGGGRAGGFWTGGHWAGGHWAGGGSPAPRAAAPGEGAEDPFAGLTLAEVERRAIEAALARNAGSVPRAARDLDVSASTLYRKLDAWGVQAPGGARGRRQP